MKKSLPNQIAKSMLVFLSEKTLLMKAVFFLILPVES